MLAPILWWALPTGPDVPCPESPNASTYAWLPDNHYLLTKLLVLSLHLASILKTFGFPSLQSCYLPIGGVLHPAENFIQTKKQIEQAPSRNFVQQGQCPLPGNLIRVKLLKISFHL
ncbi:hypothetical protein DSO57_1007358 [Entomophthora muscae]|uniref:Uncharacterized protein n=1 Tax=Entomophthora muscae TaxID=34485 RepID=A0ACC2RYQ4_9FUNG|nr:hypothetical protein DSO57_1007358 [Entomophthora muscae]